MASRVSTWAAVRTCNGSHQNVPIVPAMGKQRSILRHDSPIPRLFQGFPGSKNFNTKQCLSPKRAFVRRFWQNVKIAAWFLRGFLGQETALHMQNSRKTIYILGGSEKRPMRENGSRYPSSKRNRQYGKPSNNKKEGMIFLPCLLYMDILVGGLDHVYLFAYIQKIHPNCYSLIVFRGVGSTTNQIYVGMVYFGACHISAIV